MYNEQSHDTINDQTSNIETHNEITNETVKETAKATVKREKRKVLKVPSEVEIDKHFSIIEDDSFIKKSDINTLESKIISLEIIFKNGSEADRKSGKELLSNLIENEKKEFVTLFKSFSKSQANITQSYVSDYISYCIENTKNHQKSVKTAKEERETAFKNRYLSRIESREMTKEEALILTLINDKKLTSKASKLKLIEAIKGVIDGDNND